MKDTSFAFVICLASILPLFSSVASFGQNPTARKMEHEQAAVQRDAVLNSTWDPSFTLKSGTVNPGTTVSITCKSPNAIIYYTTGGWEPTTKSARYVGPITITETTELQSFATSPGMYNSLIVKASYIVKAPSKPVPPLTLAADGVLRAKTPLHLVTSTTVNSKKVKVGDKVGIVLDQDVKIGDTVAIPKGTPVDAAITSIVKARILSTPGGMSFAVRSLSAPGAVIPLQGGESLVGATHLVRSILLWVSFVGAAPAVMIKGDGAVVKPGMRLTATVAADTPLKP